VALWERVAEPKVGLFTKSEPQLLWQDGESIGFRFYTRTLVKRPNLAACDRIFSNHIKKPEASGLREEGGGKSVDDWVFPSPQGKARGLLNYGVIRG
jgi:hypothetical protein